MNHNRFLPKPSRTAKPGTRNAVDNLWPLQVIDLLHPVPVQHASVAYDMRSFSHASHTAVLEMQVVKVERQDQQDTPE